MSEQPEAPPTTMKITSHALVATLISLKVITAGAALAQPNPGQRSPTLQRLQQLNQVERDRQAAEDAKWRSFRIDNSKSTMPWFFNSLTNRSPSCEFYWPGWKASKDGIRITDTRKCPWDKVAVNCNSLKASWYTKAYSHWSPWSTPGKLNGPNDAYEFETETSLMVASLCDNITNSSGQRAQSQASMSTSPAIAARRQRAETKPVLTIPGKANMGMINVGAEGKQILDLLGGIGVLTEIRDKCPKAGVVGAYSRFDNLFILCTASLRNPGLATETIAHEAIHALHDCLQPGGIKGSDSLTVTSFLKTFRNGKYSADFRELVRIGLADRPRTVAYLEELRTNLPRNMYEMEVEAHALEISPKAVKSLLEAFAPLCISPT